MTLEEIYARIPAIDCKGLCAKSCGPIMCAPQEAERLPGPHRLVRTPSGFRAAEVPHTEKRGRKRCVHLRNGRCQVYELRPAICRIWGVAESLPCPHGCVPERWLSDVEAGELLRLVMVAEFA
jgi:Fe-S-cluster containining protein